MKYTYDVIVIGGGAAGLTASGIAANLGAKALLIERSRLGGDCTWTGCVPSKTLMKAAKVAHQMRHAEHYGLINATPNVDFAGLMRHVHTLREEVYQEADAPSIYERMGIEVRHGGVRFIDQHTVEIETEDGRIDLATGRYIIVAAGARAAAPPIAGLDSVPYLTNESLFEIDALPNRLGIIGAGPVGTEMAQAFNRLGSAVTVFDRGDRILSRDNDELAGILRVALEREGIAYRLGAAVESVRKRDGAIVITATAGGRTDAVEVDAVLVVTGRVPNVEDLNLEAAGVTYDRRGITVDDRCRTNRRHIFAVGDVTGRYQFTHMSEHMAKIAVTNALLKWPMKIDVKHVPWTTFTDPELAHVGATEAALLEQDESFQVYRFPYTKLDRALTDGETTGLIKVFAKGWNGRILGASILGASAGDMISEYALAMRHGIRLRQISDTIHPYPTYGLGVRRAADQWYVQKQSPNLVRLLQWVFGYRGPVNRYEPGTVV
ncbi:MAG TPA: FAD-dependent oxidoreductase [Rhodothermales bacterium]|nr:FAD-dependent oxidoreductase [Rhodothermales bacterium]